MGVDIMKQATESDEIKKAKKKRKLIGCLVVPSVILLILIIAGGVGWALLMKEHREAANLPLNAINFSKLSDGNYHGAYAGGMYKWRQNECNVTVLNGAVLDIQLLSTTDPARQNMDYEELYARVIKAQSLKVDTITSATLTSKAYLQCIENALIQAQY